MSLLQMSISAAILIIVITVLRVLFIHKLPKKTFLVFWGIAIFRLLVPISIPSILSIYSWFPKTKLDVADNFTTLTLSETLSNESGAGNIKTNIVNILPNSKQPFAFSLPAAVWLMGFTVFFLYFLFAYLRGLSKFKFSTAIKSDFIEDWKICHPLKRKLSILQSNRISSPISYGLFKPVILLPQNLDLDNVKLLEYILTHEYIHIRHFDIVYKIILIICVCIHWFNPMVWLMFILLNRDIELACDEAVIHSLGTSNRAGYAYALIDMEAQKNNIIPICNHFNKNAIEERIVAIMKNKKSSIFIVIAAFVLIVGVSTVFITSAKQSDNALKATSTKLSNEEVSKLLALKFDKYEDMSVFKYQNKVWELIDTKEYQDLLEYIDGDSELYAQKDSDDFASFLFNILEPLSSEKWQKYTFNSSVQGKYSTNSDTALLEYSFTINIKDPKLLKVKEYTSIRPAVMENFNKLMESKSEEQLQDSDFMNTSIEAEIQKLKGLYDYDKLELSFEYFYRPLISEKESDIKEVNYHEADENAYTRASKEDYEALLTLKTGDYQKLSVADFNMKLLEWTNDNVDLAERIATDYPQNEFISSLSNDEQQFIKLTVWASNIENTEFVKSQYTSKPEEDPVATIELGDKEESTDNNLLKWCNGSYQLSYHIKDKKTLSIKNRDLYLSNVMTEIQSFWNESSIESLIEMDKENIETKLEKIATANSNEDITFSIVKGQVYFDYSDEAMLSE